MCVRVGPLLPLRMPCLASPPTVQGKDYFACTVRTQSKGAHGSRNSTPHSVARPPFPTSSTSCCLMAARSRRPDMVVNSVGAASITTYAHTRVSCMTCITTHYNKLQCITMHHNASQCMTCMMGMSTTCAPPVPCGEFAPAAWTHPRDRGKCSFLCSPMHNCAHTIVHTQLCTHKCAHTNVHPQLCTHNCAHTAISSVRGGGAPVFSRIGLGDWQAICSGLGLDNT